MHLIYSADDIGAYFNLFAERLVYTSGAIRVKDVVTDWRPHAVPLETSIYH